MGSTTALGRANSDVIDSTWPTTWWHALPDGRVQCDLCPRECRLHEGQRGLCFVRARQGDAIVSTTYGRSSGYCIDPVEKKPLNHFLPGSSVLSFGTAGCNLTCKFCQNWDISKSRDIDTLADSAMPDDIARAAERLGCASVAFTYNDPVIFAEYAIDTAIACRDRGIRTVAVTAGYINRVPRAFFFRHMDAANIDLKGFTREFYRKVCGAELDRVLDTIDHVANRTSTWLELTTLLIGADHLRGPVTGLHRAAHGAPLHGRLHLADRARHLGHDPLAAPGPHPPLVARLGMPSRRLSLAPSSHAAPLRTGSRPVNVPPPGVDRPACPRGRGPSRSLVHARGTTGDTRLGRAETSRTACAVRSSADGRPVVAPPSLRADERPCRRSVCIR